MTNINKFIYVHVLKTAGTTFRYTILEKYFKETYLYDGTFKIKRHRKFREKYPLVPLVIEDQPYPQNYRKYDIIFGHFKYDKYEHLNRPMFSFVRNPVDRMVSNYYYFKTFYERRNKNLSLIEFSEIWKNHMTYILDDISKYTFIGNVENFKKSLDRMCDSLGIEPPKKIISRRVQRKSKENKISKKIRKKIENMNMKDMELYYKVLKKWQ